jgi:hypothetical protein
MEDLVLLDDKRIIVEENINYIQTLRKHQRDDEKWLKIFEDGDKVLWFPKDPKIKEGDFFSLDWFILSE